MHQNRTAATVARPIGEVFDFVTTPARWPQYWPISMSIEGAETQRPLRAGDRFTEHVRILSWRGEFDWVVETLERPHRCVIAATGKHKARIEYTLSGDERETQFVREIAFPEASLWEKIADLVGFGKAIDMASGIAMETLVSILENPWLHGPQVDSAAESLFHEADPMADAAVASLISSDGDTTALQNFLAALYRGDPPPASVPEPMRRFLDDTAARPAWACEPRLKAASKIFLEWGTLTVAAHIGASLPETYMIPRTARLLDLTRQLDRDPTHVDRRLWFTVRMCFDVLDEHGLDPSGHGMLALQRLRLLHAMVRLFVQHRLETPHRLSGFASRALWNSDEGQPISQIELLHTLLTFSHVVLRSFDVWNCGITPYQREAYIHIWNVAGMMLGIRPELLPRDAADAARIFEEIKTRYGGATEESKKLGYALSDFWTSLFPKVVRKEALELMHFVVSGLISPETATANGFDQLPSFSSHAVKVLTDYLHVKDRAVTNLFTDLPPLRQAATLIVALAIRARSDSYEEDSGVFDVPDMLYSRWMGVPATS